MAGEGTRFPWGPRVGAPWSPGWGPMEPRAQGLLGPMGLRGPGAQGTHGPLGTHGPQGTRGPGDPHIFVSPPGGGPILNFGLPYL